MKILPLGHDWLQNGDPYERYRFASVSFATKVLSLLRSIWRLFPTLETRLPPDYFLKVRAFLSVPSLIAVSL
jgi:hypothetical protein